VGSDEQSVSASRGGAERDVTHLGYVLRVRESGRVYLVLENLHEDNARPT
jgi:hypothetical protein